MRTSPVAVLAMIAALSGCSSSDREPAPTEDRFKAEVFSTAEFGTRLGITVDFPDDRTVTGAQLNVGERILGPDLYASDGSDQEPPPDPLPLDAGEQALVEASLPPDCDVPGDRPVFVVLSKTKNGGTQTDRFPIANAAEFRRAADKVCEMGPQLMLAGSTTRPDGSFMIELTVTNPGESAELVSRAWTSGRTTWRSARTEVPSGGSALLEITGTGQGCSHDGPWENELVTLGDKVLPPPAQGYDSPC